MDFIRAGGSACRKIIAAFPRISCDRHLILPVSQTCFCCVLHVQDSGSAADSRRDDLAAEMLKALAKPFMV
jgi:hypothetical protein